MWTSTYKEHGLSDWCQWCLENEFWVRRDQPVFQAWELTVDLSAAIFVIDGRDDLKTLIERYPAPPLAPNGQPLGSTFEFPNWELVAADYDGVHLTARGQIATRWYEPNLYGWDCESTLWLHWSFPEITYRGLVWVPEQNERQAEEVPHEANTRTNTRTTVVG